MDDEIAPHGCSSTMISRARGQPALSLTWYDGGLRPRPRKRCQGTGVIPRGVLFVGDKGVILGEGPAAADAVPRDEAAGYTKPERPRASKGHHRDWLDASKGGAAASSNFESGARLTELFLLGILAVRLGRRVDWDAERMEARGISEAEPIIREPYRAGWELGE